MVRTRRIVLGGLVALAVVLLFLLAVAPSGERPVARSTTTTAASPARVEVSGTFDFDPFGPDLHENAQYVKLATDGDSLTGWRTESYNRRADLGGLKPGVGLVFDLGREVAPREVTITASAGTSLELRTASSRASSLEAWSVVPGASRSELEGASGSSTATVTVRTGSVRSRYWLLWLTRLSADGARYRSEVREVVFGRE